MAAMGAVGVTATGLVARGLGGEAVTENRQGPYRRVRDGLGQGPLTTAKTKMPFFCFIYAFFYQLKPSSSS